MSFIDKQILKSFYPEESFLIGEAEGSAELITQIDTIINSYTGISIPATPAVAHPVLRNIACQLFVWYSSARTGVNEKDYPRIKAGYDNAMQMLSLIASGELNVGGATEPTGATFSITSNIKGAL